MVNLLNNQAEAYSVETFACGHCEKDFQAKIITWVDVSRAPQAKPALLQWKFNIPHCSNRSQQIFLGVWRWSKRVLIEHYKSYVHQFHTGAGYTAG